MPAAWVLSSAEKLFKADTVNSNETMTSSFTLSCSYTARLVELDTSYQAVIHLGIGQGITSTHQILISNLHVEKVRHKSVSPHTSLGDLKCLPSTPSSVDMCFCTAFLAAEGNFSSAEQSPDLWCPGCCKPVTDACQAVRGKTLGSKIQPEPIIEVDIGEKWKEKTNKQTKLNQGMIVYVPLLPAGFSSHLHPDEVTLLWRKDLTPPRSAEQ